MSSGSERPASSHEAHGVEDVVVLGASFAGLELVRRLRKDPRTRRLSIAVVDRQAHHPYIPLVHERLVDRVSARATTLPTAEVLARLDGVRFIHDQVVAMQPADHRVELASGGTVCGRFVVVALGSVLTAPSSILGADRILSHKSAEQFDRARAAIESLLVDAAIERDIVVIGGGISGVELAGELAHLQRRAPDRWRRPRVTLVHARERLMPELERRVADRAERALRDQGVDVRLRTRVSQVHEGTVTIALDDGDTREIAADLAFWTGGVRPAPVLGALGLPRTEDGWLRVSPTLEPFPGPRDRDAELFVCGDAARVVGDRGTWPTMQRAIECLWQAALVADNIATLSREPPGYPNGLPSLRPHRLRSRFPYGVSLGARSLVVYGNLVIDQPRLDGWFRRWLMGKYFERYGVAMASADHRDQAM